MSSTYKVLRRHFKQNPRQKVILFAFASLIINMLYALGNFAIGIYQLSYWFITAGAYYLVLSVMRFAAVLFERKNGKNEIFIKRFSGVMIIFLSFVLSCTVYLSIRHDVAGKFHEIIMITIALYTFIKITLAIINVVKTRKEASPLLSTLRNISLCDAAVSIFSLQRSMLVSFEGMTPENIRLMNILTGSGVWLVVLVLGILMLRKEKNPCLHQK